MRRAAVAGVLALWLGSATACSQYDSTKPAPPKFRLEGSATQLYDLGYDEARILLAEEDVALLFVRIRALATFLPDGGFVDTSQPGQTEDYPLRVAYSLWGGPVPSGVVDLTEVDSNENQRGVVSRDVLQDPRKSYPKLKVGELRLNKTPVPGATVTGDFHITFENGTETASGRTVFGNFTAKVAQ